MSSDTIRAEATARVGARRERHRRRPMPVRVAAGFAGFLLSAAGALLIWAPELGLPLLVAGLGLLALEYDWAMRPRVWAEWRLILFKERLKRLSPAVKFGVPLALLALLVVAAVLPRL